MGPVVVSAEKSGTVAPSLIMNPEELGPPLHKERREIVAWLVLVIVFLPFLPSTALAEAKIVLLKGFARSCTVLALGKFAPNRANKDLPTGPKTPPNIF